MLRLFHSFGNVACLSSSYPYEVIVFFIVLSIGIWPVADSSFIVKKVKNLIVFSLSGWKINFDSNASFNSIFLDILCQAVQWAWLVNRRCQMSLNFTHFLSGAKIEIIKFWMVIHCLWFNWSYCVFEFVRGGVVNCLKFKWRLWFVLDFADFVNGDWTWLCSCIVGHDG